jgi:hypothetical protein
MSLEQHQTLRSSLNLSTTKMSVFVCVCVRVRACVCVRAWARQAVAQEKREIEMRRPWV